MSGRDRRRYLTETVLNQEFLDWSHDNLDNQLEMIVDIETPTGMIYASDRNKYVDGIFYEALLSFQRVSRSVGEYLAPEIQYGSQTLELSNVDGRFNDILPGGANYASWVGGTVEIKLGLAEAGSTYKSVFKGRISDVGGFRRSVKSITLIAKDDYERLNVSFPNQAFTLAAFPNIEDSVVGKLAPVIYGDWTTGLDPDPAVVPTFLTNGKDATVTAAPWNNLQLRISQNDLLFFDTTKVYMLRGEVYHLVPAADVVSVGAGNKSFQVRQNTSAWLKNDDGSFANYTYQNGDVFYVRVKGKDLGAYSDNPIWQARDLLLTYGAVVSSDFHSNWATFRDKASPAQSALASIKSRVWENEAKPLMQYALSILEQVRMEAFISRDLKIQLSSLHFDNFVAAPSFTLRNWDVVEGTFSPTLDDRMNFNRAQGVFDYRPNRNENALRTPILKNQSNITAIGRAISKEIAFPNLYVAQDVKNQLTEILKISSSFLEVIQLECTWRSMLKELGDFVFLNVQIGSSQFTNVPAMIRDIGYDPQGLKIPMQLWSFALCPFPGYTPGFAGTTGGFNAVITEE